jgi:phage tail sheath protein FI
MEGTEEKNKAEELIVEYRKVKNTEERIQETEGQIVTGGQILVTGHKQGIEGRIQGTETTTTPATTLEEAAAVGTREIHTTTTGVTATVSEWRKLQR